MKRMVALVWWMMLASVVFAAQGAPATNAARAGAPKRTAPAAVSLKPTLANVAYGASPKQVLDFWKAKADKPTPLLFYIHGGGWMHGDRSSVIRSGLARYLAAGVSVVSVEYRFVSEAHAAGIQPPVQWPLEDAARALQFVRSKAAEWNLDPQRVGASGSSAGACSSLWLAFHDDLADKGSADPIARESTRLMCAGVAGAQTSLDPRQMREWIPNITYGPHAFGYFTMVKGTAVMDFNACLAARDKILPWINQYSPAALVSGDDPPVCLCYSAPPPAAGKLAKDPTHSATFGVKLKEILDAKHVPCHLIYPKGPPDAFKSEVEYLIATLKP